MASEESADSGPAVQGAAVSNSDSAIVVAPFAMNKKMKDVSSPLTSNAKPAQSGEREILANLSITGFSGSVGLETVSSVTVSSLSVGPVVTNCEAVVSNRDILSLPVETVTIHSGEECCSGSDGNYFSCAHSELGVFKLEPINTNAVDFQTVCVAVNQTALKLVTQLILRLNMVLELPLDLWRVCNQNSPHFHLRPWQGDQVS